MMIDEVRDYLAENCEGAVLFDNPSFDDSIIGYTDTAVVYDYNEMINEFVKDNNCTIEEASEFIAYNTMRMLPYIKPDEPLRKPIIMYGFVKEVI